MLERNCAPPEMTFGSKCWLMNQRLHMFVERDRLIQVALNIYKLTINNWSVEQFMYHYKIYKPLFHAADEAQYNERYLSFYESLHVMFKLLFFQFNDIESIRKFLLTVYKVCNRDNGKVNSILIMGESNAGKNFFADALCNFFLNCGMVVNPSRQERFPFMDCLNRRILMWNEARLDPHFYDDFKQLLAGDQLKAHIKFQAPQYIGKTPVIILSNNDVFGDDIVFKNRIIKYKWKRADFLYNYKYRYPTPFVVGYILSWAALQPLCNYRYINEIIDMYTM